MHTQQQHKNKFIAVILQALHLKFDQFIYNLAHREPYETIVYRWINKLYSQQKSSDQAIQLIYKARNVFLLDRCRPEAGS